MTVQEVVQKLQEIAPLAYAEDFDNVGLLVGNPLQPITGILVTLDTLESVVDEAIQKKCNLIVSFHPIIFSGLKKITGKTYVERVVIKAIQNQIAIVSIHTAMDNHHQGVNFEICKRLGIAKPQILIPKANTIYKLSVNVPKQNETELKQALFSAGAGNIGNYQDCSFTVTGTGTFTPKEDANPAIGKINKIETLEEVQLQCIFPSYLKETMVNTLWQHHPFEEIAYEIIALKNNNQQIGMGMIGDLEEPMSEADFLQFVKKQFDAQGIRYSALLNKPVQKVAVLGGSGSFAIKNAKQQQANVFITADIKYHQFYEAENKIVILDIGHYESEQYTKNLIVSNLQKKISNFAIILSEINTNPIQYL
ncbi:Nif3-like dinuclear metal center hexameric protein [Aquimarina sp. ERC-38]|uniref:Nif3-like dinuclear metal center hexameric protein n=1 Tax=Aquimarina sp. ERC-38 TaxID=2949996 RepID=UPI0022451690|nr:Nif3-like dinuclear metal center hexameric protein [Aquimarina sp. ERC-38]UZO80584.1 Nif3-like dinuclear metal center hexameric protein [Aquimarina sp. ERC-38]